MPIQRMTRLPMTRPPQAVSTLTPKDIISILKRHILLMIVMTIIGVIAGGISWYLLLTYAPKYRASTYIKILPPVERDPLTIGGGTVAKDIQYGYRLTIASIIRQQGTLENLLRRDKIKKTQWYQSFGSEENEAKRITDALDDLGKHLGVSAHRDAEFVSVSMTCADAQESADIANETVDMFIASQSDTKVGEVRRKLVELEARRRSIEQNLDLAERALDDVRRSSGIGDLEEHQFQDTITLRMNALDEEQRDLMLTVSQLQSQIERFEEVAQGPINEQIENSIERDPTMVMLTQQLFSTKTALAQLQTKFGEGHRNVIELRKRAQELQERRNIRKAEIGEQTRQANLQNAKDQLVVIESRFESAKAQLQQAAIEKSRLDAAKVQYDQRLRIRDQLQDTLNGVKGLIEKHRILAEDPETPKVMKMGNALKPREVSSPLWYVYFPGGTFLGFACGVGLAFLIELLNDLLRTPRDVVRYIPAPLLSVIPNASEDNQTHGIDLCHVVRLAPYSVVSEAFRKLRVNLRLSQSRKSVKVIFVSSCGAGDGKTTVAVNLATTLANEGEKILIIDANFWKSMLHKAFPQSGLDTKYDKKAKSDVGLSNYLLGQTSVEEIIRPSGIDRFDVIDAGTTSKNPTELLASEKMVQLLQEQRQFYDHIIIDGPPVLLVIGAKVLAGISDCTMMVFNADRTRRGAGQRAVRELREIDAEIIGCVLMGARTLKGGYFHEQYKLYRKYQEPLMAS